MPSLDTNVILALLLSEREKEREAVLRLVARHDELAISDIAIVETVFVLEASLKFSRANIAIALESLMANQHLSLNRQMLAQVIPHYLKHPAVSFYDICLAVYAKLHNQTPLLTFDRKLARQIPHVDEITR